MSLAGANKVKRQNSRKFNNHDNYFTRNLGGYVKCKQPIKAELFLSRILSWSSGSLYGVKLFFVCMI